MRAPALFVAGTDTGVGKTWVATSLCRALAARGLRVGVFKPAETGCADPDRPADALALLEAAGSAEPLDAVCPYRLAEPLAPAVAARRQGVRIEPELLAERFAVLRERHDVVLCEGAGGLLVPLAAGLLSADWVEAQGLPVLLVARVGLGTINHTLLSARCLGARGIALLGTILSAAAPPASVAEATNPEVLADYPEVRLLGVAAHGKEVPESIVDVVWARLATAAGP
ncbi:MAG: dethiobiotin synthase [Deltaproteobacteria bacterium]|nr:dethiobiotin synthase [Deltaproteobacteria bacterium]